MRAVEQHGRKWTLLQQQQCVPGRTGRQMKDRFVYVLDPALDRTAMCAEVSHVCQQMSGRAQGRGGGGPNASGYSYCATVGATTDIAAL
jgi:hypothetical protein